MRIRRRTIYSQILDVDEGELEQIVGLLTFEQDDGILKCLITDSGKFLSGLVPFLQSKGVKFDIEDAECIPLYPILQAKDLVLPNLLDDRILRDYQIKGTIKTLAVGRGILQSSTGSGKTEMAAAAIEHYRCLGNVKTVICLVPTVFLMEQLADKFESWGLGKVGRMGKGNVYEGEDIVVAVVNSAFNALESGEPANLHIRNADMLILDEAHHAKANMWRKVCESCKARIRLAYTATAYSDPEKYSYEDLILIGLIGPIFYEVRSVDLRRRGYLANPTVTFLRPKSSLVPSWSWTKVYKLGIVRNKARNSMIVSLAHRLYEANRRTMIFVGYKWHGHLLAQMLQDAGCESIFVHGGSTVFRYTPSGVRRRTSWGIDRIADYVNNRDRSIVIATSVLDEGIDVPIIDSLIMAAGMKKYRRTIQRAGRGMRPKGFDNRVYIFDFWDCSHRFLLTQSKYRLWTYQVEEYHISKSLEETSELIGTDLVSDEKFLHDG